MLNDTETIAAISTAQGNGGIGIVRISGTHSLKIAKKICTSSIKPKHINFCNFIDSSDEILDQGIVLYFPNPHSFTGEDVVEIQGHGGQVVLNELLSLCFVNGARLAEPGEFTKRAYLNNKIDLAQAESVIDIINATSIQAVKSASQSLTGKFSKKISNLLQSIISIRVYVEACIDFPEEEIDFIEKGNVTKKLQGIIAEVDEILKTSKQSQLLKNGVNLVLIGRPNVGKSSLLNCLSGIDSSIVTDIPGTTRDVVSTTISMKGVLVNIIDTAGLRETEDKVEKLGIKKTWQAVQNANAVIILSDISSGLESPDDFMTDKLPRDVSKIYVLNKIDLLPESKLDSIKKNKNNIFYISAKYEKGIDQLRDFILESITNNIHHDSKQSPLLARSRQIASLNLVRDNVCQALIQKDSSELIAEELTQAQKNLSSITGDFTNEDLLGEIFSSFCIGK